MEFSQHLLSILVWLPIIGGAALILIGDQNDSTSPRAGIMRIAALVVSMLTFLISILLYASFDNAATGMQFIEKESWVASLNVYYSLGVDGLSAPLILLTTFITRKSD